MREFRQVFVDIARQLDDAARATQQLEAERWRRELRPRALRLFAARTGRLTWTRAFVRLFLEELQQPDDLFAEIVGSVDRIPPSRFPQAVAIALALRHSWRRDEFTRIAKRLRISLTSPSDQPTPGHHDPDSRARLGPVKAFRCASTPHGADGLDRTRGRTSRRHVRDGQGQPRRVTRKD